VRASCTRRTPSSRAAAVRSTSSRESPARLRANVTRRHAPSKRCRPGRTRGDRRRPDDDPAPPFQRLYINIDTWRRFGQHSHDEPTPSPRSRLRGCRRQRDHRPSREDRPISRTTMSFASRIGPDRPLIWRWPSTDECSHRRRACASGHLRPERREEITTEGGLDVTRAPVALAHAMPACARPNPVVALHRSRTAMSSDRASSARTPSNCIPELRASSNDPAQLAALAAAVRACTALGLHVHRRTRTHQCVTSHGRAIPEIGASAT